MDFWTSALVVVVICHGMYTMLRDRAGREAALSLLTRRWGGRIADFGPVEGVAGKCWEHSGDLGSVRIYYHNTDAEAPTRSTRVEFTAVPTMLVFPRMEIYPQNGLFSIGKRLGMQDIEI